MKLESKRKIEKDKSRSQSWPNRSDSHKSSVVTKLSSCSRKSSSPNMRENSAPNPAASKLELETFGNVLEYLASKLWKSSQNFNGPVASNAAKLVRPLQSELKEMEFHKALLLSILPFLKRFRDACESICLYGVVTMSLLPSFKDKPASSSLSAHILSTKSKTFELQSVV